MQLSKRPLQCVLLVIVLNRVLARWQVPPSPQQPRGTIVATANIVFEDAALNQAVEGIVNGIFFNQGHVCCAGSRLLLEAAIADDARSGKQNHLLQRHSRRRDVFRALSPVNGRHSE